MKVETFYISDFEDPEIGLVVDENEDWILVKNIPIDYVIDGYKVYRKRFVEQRINSEKERKIEKVLGLKGIKPHKPNNFNFLDTEGILKWVEESYGLFEFQDLDGSEATYGKINKISAGVLIIDFIDSEGDVEEEYDYEYSLEEIKVITFETDYHNSISLLWQDKNKNV